MLPLPGSPPDPQDDTEGSDEPAPEGVAYDVQPRVVAVLVGVLALMIVVTVLVVSNLQTARATAPRPSAAGRSAGVGADRAVDGPPLGSRSAPATTSPTTSAATGSSATNVAPNGQPGPAPGSSAANPAAPAPTGAPPGATAGSVGGPAVSPPSGTSGTAAVGPSPRPTPAQVPAGNERAGGETASAGGQVAPAPAPGSATGDAAPPPTPAPTSPPAPAPAAAVPVGLNAVPGQQTAVVRWSVSGPTAQLAGFEVVWSGGGRDIRQQVGPAARLAQADGLSPSTGYAVAVTPLRPDGQPDPGAARSIDVTTLPGALAPPAGPAAVSVTPGPGSLTVTWTADPGDLATTQFFVSWGCCSGYLGGVSVDRDVRSYTITGLQPGVQHMVEVQSLGPNLEGEPQTKRAAFGTPN